MRKHHEVNSTAYPFKKSLVRNADVQKVIFRTGAGLGPHMLSFMHDDGILKDDLIDSFRLGEVVSKYGNALTEQADKLCFHNIIMALSDTKYVPIVSEDEV